MAVGFDIPGELSSPANGMLGNIPANIGVGSRASKRCHLLSGSIKDIDDVVGRPGDAIPVEACEAVSHRVQGRCLAQHLASWGTASPLALLYSLEYLLNLLLCWQGNSIVQKAVGNPFQGLEGIQFV